jgi:putative redox protein
MAVIRARIDQVGPSTSQGSIRDHSVLVDRPEAKGGHDRGAMGGELLLASLGGCFNSNLLAAIAAREADIDGVSIAIEGTLEGTPPHYTSIHMGVSARHDDRDLLEKLVTISERSCIVANTLKGSVDLTIEVVDRPPAAT